MRVVLGHRVAGDAGALDERAVGAEALLLHVPDDPAVHRLEPVAHVGQGPRDDDGHRVVEEDCAPSRLAAATGCTTTRVVGDVAGASPLGGIGVSAHQMSRKRTSLALVLMKFLRDSTSSPIRTLITLVGQGGLFDLDLQQRARRGIHRGPLQLFPVHLAEALQPLELLLVVRAAPRGTPPWPGRP